jgi:hypothetical protein
MDVAVNAGIPIEPNKIFVIEPDGVKGVGDERVCDGNVYRYGI